MGRKYTPAQMEQIHGLKQSSDNKGYFVFPVGDDTCRMKILGRGEVAFYQRGERALLFELLAGRGVVFRHSIRVWDTGERVSAQELELVLAHATDALRQLGFERVVIS